MERLTYDFCVGSVHCNQVRGADNLECGEVCQRQDDDGCATCPIARAFDRLAAIEDILGDEYDLDRLRELAQADREGRCVVLPCKVGDPVYMATGRSRITGYEEDICDGFFIDRTGKLQIKARNYTGNHGTYGSLEDGSVQLTRESAEKALEEMEETRNG